MIKTIARLGAAVALSASVVAGTAMVDQLSPTASAAGLSCGDAKLDLNATRTKGYLTHSCEGTGTVLYEIECVGTNTQVSHSYVSPGLSISKPVYCGGRNMISVSWEVK